VSSTLKPNSSAIVNSKTRIANRYNSHDIKVISSNNLAMKKKNATTKGTRNEEVEDGVFVFSSHWKELRATLLLFEES